VALEVGNRWVAQRSALLAIADDSLIWRALRSDDARAVTLVGLEKPVATTRESVQLLLIRDSDRRPRWVLASDATGRPELISAAESSRVSNLRVGGAITAELPVRGSSADQVAGYVEARLRVATMLPLGIGGAAAAGAMIAMVDRTTGVSVVPPPFDASLLSRDDFEWEGRRWLTVRRSLEEPAVELLAAEPLDLYVAPVERAARRGLFVLIGVAIGVLAIATILTRRVTHSLEEFAVAAEAVSGGDLDRQVSSRGSDEVSRVARAFNAMTENLRATLRELSQRQAVAAVGEFASALAHEVRNPLSAMKLNLQHVEQHAQDHPMLREAVDRALRDIERLNRTVSAALRVARSGRAPLQRIDIWSAIDGAVRAAQPEFTARGAAIAVPAANARVPTYVKGDAAALEQLFLNLVLNAAQASDAGGRAGIDVDTSGDHVNVVVWDGGRGIPESERARIFDAFYSTKPEGTGLGLTLARRIASAHGGTIQIDDSSEPGSRFRVTVPRLRSVADAASS